MKNNVNQLISKLMSMNLKLGYHCAGNDWFNDPKHRPDLWLNESKPLTGYMKSAREKHLVVVVMDTSLLDRYQFSYPVHNADGYSFHKIGNITTDELNNIFSSSTYLAGGNSINVWLAIPKYRNIQVSQSLKAAC